MSGFRGNRGGSGGRRPEFRHVGSEGQLNSKRVLGALGGVVQAQPLADLARFHPHRGVVAGVVVGRPAEDVDPYGALLEEVAVPAEGVLDDVPEKFLAALAGAELVAGENPFEFFPNRIGRDAHGPMLLRPLRVGYAGSLSFTHRRRPLHPNLSDFSTRQAAESKDPMDVRWR